MTKETKEKAKLVDVEVVQEAVKVTVDLNKVTWGKVMKIQRALASNAGEEEAERIITEIITDVTGQDAYELPAFVVGEVLNRIINFSESANRKNG